MNMRPKTLGFHIFLNGESLQTTLPVDEIEINVNGGYTHWNRWVQPTQNTGHISLGIDLSRSATVERDQAINRSTLSGAFISRLKGKQHG